MPFTRIQRVIIGLAAWRRAMKLNPAHAAADVAAGRLRPMLTVEQAHRLAHEYAGLSAELTPMGRCAAGSLVFVPDDDGVEYAFSVHRPGRYRVGATETVLVNLANGDVRIGFFGE